MGHLVWSLDSEDPLKDGTAIHSSTLAWRIPWTEEPGGLQSVGSQRVRHDWSNVARMYAYGRNHIKFLVLFEHQFSPFCREHRLPSHHRTELNWNICSVVSNSATPRTVARQAPLSMGFSRQECWNGLLCPPLGDLPDPGIKPVGFLCLLHWQAGSLPLAPSGKHYKNQ